MKAKRIIVAILAGAAFAFLLAAQSSTPSIPQEHQTAFWRAQAQFVEARSQYQAAQAAFQKAQQDREAAVALLKTDCGVSDEPQIHGGDLACEVKPKALEKKK